MARLFHIDSKMYIQIDIYEKRQICLGLEPPQNILRNLQHAWLIQNWTIRKITNTSIEVSLGIVFNLITNIFTGTIFKVGWFLIFLIIITSKYSVVWDVTSKNIWYVFRDKRYI